MIEIKKGEEKGKKRGSEKLAVVTDTLEHPLGHWWQKLQCTLVEFDIVHVGVG